MSPTMNGDAETGEPEQAYWLDVARLEELLEWRGMSKADLARKLNISDAAVAKYFRRNMNPRRQTLARLAAALRVPERALAGGRSIASLKEEEEVRKEEAVEEAEPAGRPGGTHRRERVRVRVVDDWGPVPTRRGKLQRTGNHRMTVSADLVEGIANPVIVRLTSDHLAPEYEWGEYLAIDPDLSWEDDNYHLLGYGPQEFVALVRVEANWLRFATPAGEPCHVPMREVELHGVVVNSWVKRERRKVPQT